MGEQGGISLTEHLFSPILVVVLQAGGNELFSLVENFLTIAFVIQS